MHQETKPCGKCGKDKPLFDFHKNKTKKTGRQSHCKSCDKVREKGRTRKTIKRKQGHQISLDARLRAKAYGKKYASTPERLAIYAASSRVYYRNNPEKVKAKSAVLKARNQGKLVVPANCSVCGEASKLDAHHADYSKPLDVRWLCRKCHKRVHFQLVD